MTKTLVAHHWVDGKSLQFKTLPNKIVSNYTEVGVVFYSIRDYDSKIGYLSFDNPFFKQQKIRINIDYRSDTAGLHDYFYSLSSDKIKEHVLYIEFIRLTKQTVKKDDVDKNNPTYLNLLQDFNKKNIVLPFLEKKDRIYKLFIPPNTNCDFYFLDTYAINHKPNPKAGHYEINMRDVFIPDILYNINIKINHPNSKLIHLFSYSNRQYYDYRPSEIVYISLEEKFINSFQIVITDIIGQEIESKGSIVLHFKSE